MKALRISLVFVLCAAALSAQTVLVNAADSVFYYISGGGRSALIAGQGVSQIPPGGFAYADSGRVTGFFFVTGRTSHPGLELYLDDTTSGLKVDLPLTPSFTVDTLVPPDIDAPIRLDNRYLEWNAVPVAGRFSRHFVPETIVRRQGTFRESKPGDDSRLFGKGGSDLELIRLIKSGDGLYLMASTYSAMAPGLSILLYGYDSEDAASASLTIEVAFTEELPTILLWRGDVPEVVGTFVSSSYFVEGVLWLDRLPSDVDLFGDIQFYELGTALSDAGVTEIFPFSRIPVSRIPEEDA